MEIIIDNREKALKDYFIINNNNLFNISYENLILGDIIIKYNNNLYYIFERKTNTDLASSIKDKRFHEQKSRLKEFVKDNTNVRIIYIYESLNIFPNYSKNDIVNGINGEILQSSIINTCLSDMFGIFITKSCDDTIHLLNEIFNRMIKRPERYFYDSVISNTNNLIQKKKKENITNNNILILMLSQIPGISVKISECVYSHHKSMNDLIIKLNDFETHDDRIKYISGLGFPMKNDKIRRVGLKAGEKIINFIY